MAIVTQDLRLVEHVTGRATVMTRLLAGAASGGWVGLLVGILFSLFDWYEPGLSTLRWMLSGLIFGAVGGVIFGAASHLATEGRRDFTSVASLEADRWRLTGLGYRLAPEPTFNVDVLRRLYVDERLPAAHVAARLGLTEEQVRGRLRRAGLRRQPAVSAEQVRSLYEQGLSIRATGGSASRASHARTRASPPSTATSVDSQAATDWYDGRSWHDNETPTCLSAGGTCRGRWSSGSLKQHRMTAPRAGRWSSG